MCFPFVILSRKKYNELLAKSISVEKDYRRKLKSDVVTIMINGMCVAWGAVVTDLKSHTWDQDLCDKIHSEFMDSSTTKDPKDLSWKLGLIRDHLQNLYRNIDDRNKWQKQFSAMINQIADFINLLREKE